MREWFRSKLYIPFRFGRNGRKILYRYANRYKITPHSTLDKISECFGSFRPFRWISSHFDRFTFLGFFIFYFFLYSPFSPPLLLLSFFHPALSLCLYTFSLLFFFLSFWFKSFFLLLFSFFFFFLFSA